jgi:hypothetical protein
MTVVSINIFLYQMEAGRNVVGGRKERGKERKRGAD